MAKITDKKLIRAGMKMTGFDKSPIGQAVKILLEPDDINRSKTSERAKDSPNDNY